MSTEEFKKFADELMDKARENGIQIAILYADGTTLGQAWCMSNANRLYGGEILKNSAMREIQRTHTQQEKP